MDELFEERDAKRKRGRVNETMEILKISLWTRIAYPNGISDGKSKWKMSGFSIVMSNKSSFGVIK